MKGTTTLQNFTLAAGFIAAVALPPTQANQEPVCVYISSYHSGLEWSDRIENGLRKGLGKECRILQYDMDTKQESTGR